MGPAKAGHYERVASGFSRTTSYEPRATSYELRTTDRVSAIMNIRLHNP